MTEAQPRNWHQVLINEINSARVHADGSCIYHEMHHVMLHEAAHAVFAIRRGVPFVELTVLPPKFVNRQLLENGQAHAGWLQPINDDPAQWIPQVAEEALDMLVAGALAERFFFDCYLEKSYLGDMQLWSAGMGAETAEQAGPAIESSSLRVWNEMSRCSGDVQAVASALQAQLKPPVDGVSIFDEALTLTHKQVESLIAGHVEGA
ncbi:hypothetical protein ACIPYV_12760 [Paenarthrobacter nicotinovorans]|uniref:hypothetical protein n=1 Tax=Paenarthrobacter nicotinovorans TaxID=29320 RepID=UPI003826B6D3